MSARASKRKRSSAATVEVNGDIDKHTAFTQWARDRGVVINGVKSASLPGRGRGIIATKRLKQGDRILFIPEKAMFKPDQALLKREALDKASPHAQLALSAMIAFCDSRSEMKVWEDTWPTASDFEACTPIYWRDTLRDLLPTSVHQPLDRQLADYSRDWDAAKSLCSKQGLSESDFKYYWMIVNSRSFLWKPPRGKAGTMVMCPFIDYLNHGPNGSGCNVEMGGKGFEVIADRTYEPGEELLVTYGAHSNDKLLVHYGFICSSTPDGPSTDDDIRLDHLILPELSEDVRNQLQDVGFLGAYALLPASNELCFKTQVAVRAALLTCNEWEYFAANGEDLSNDYSAAVREFVKKLLAKYRGDAVQRLDDVNRSGDGPQQDILALRWNQIIEAIDAFAETGSKSLNK